MLTVLSTTDATVANGPDHNYNSGLKNLSDNSSAIMSPVGAGSSSELRSAGETVLDPISRV